MANTNVYQRNNENSRQRRNMHQLTHHTSLVSTYFNLGAVMDAMVVRVLSVEVMYRCIAVSLSRTLIVVVQLSGYRRLLTLNVFNGISFFSIVVLVSGQSNKFIVVYLNQYATNKVHIPSTHKFCVLCFRRTGTLILSRRRADANRRNNFIYFYTFYFYDVVNVIIYSVQALPVYLIFVDASLSNGVLLVNAS